MFVLNYLSAVLQRPGGLAATYFTGRQRIKPWLVLLGLVTFTTLGLMELQAYHPAWASIRQAVPSSPAQTAQWPLDPHYWGVYFNLRQLVLLPLYALPTWLVYRQQGVRYVNALLMHVFWNTAFNLYALLLFGLMASQVVRITTRGGGLAFVLMLVYLVAIGRTALDLRWTVAGGKALLTGLLIVGLLRLLGCVGL